MPKTSDGIRDKIITAGRIVFGKSGLTKTTIDGISQQAGMAKSSLYYYFKSKEELFIAVIEREAIILKAAIADAMASAESPQDKLREYFIKRMMLFKELTVFYSVFRKEYIQNYAFIYKIRKQYDIYEVDLIKGILSRGVASGIFNIKNLDLTSEVIHAALKGLEYDWIVDVSEKSIGKNITMLTEILLHGIMKT